MNQCRYCLHYKPSIIKKEINEGTFWNPKIKIEEVEGIGGCHKSPPIPEKERCGEMYYWYRGTWPRVSPDDFCGDFMKRD